MGSFCDLQLLGYDLHVTVQLRRCSVIYQVRLSDLTSGQIFKLTYRGQHAYVSMRLDTIMDGFVRHFSIAFSLKVVASELITSGARSAERSSFLHRGQD